MWYYTSLQNTSNYLLRLNSFVVYFIQFKLKQVRKKQPGMHDYILIKQPFSVFFCSLMHISFIFEVCRDYAHIHTVLWMKGLTLLPVKELRAGHIWTKKCVTVLYKELYCMLTVISYCLIATVRIMTSTFYPPLSSCWFKNKTSLRL